MGFGCNVPAVVATRSCPSCSRGTCVSAICFGSACSYQLPATLAVFAATGLVGLAPWYIALLTITSTIYLRLTRLRTFRNPENDLPLPESGHLRLPDWRAISRETFQSLREFFVVALPIFVGIASLLEYYNGLELLLH